MGKRTLISPLCLFARPPNPFFSPHNNKKRKKTARANQTQKSNLVFVSFSHCHVTQQRSQANNIANRKLTLDDDHNGDYSYHKQPTTTQRTAAALSSATRAGIRGFTLAFLAGTVMDVLLPALLKQKFKGLIRRVFTDPSSLRLGASCGLFAFVYKLSFHIIALALESLSKDQQQQRVSGSRRSDSGIGLAGSHRKGHKDGKIAFGGLTQLDHSGDDENHQLQSGSEDDDDALLCSPKEQATRNRKKWVPALLAALMAAPAYSLIPDQARRLTMALYFLTYAGESAYAALEHEGLLKWLPSWVGIWILAPISTSQIVHTFIQHNDCNPVSFFIIFFPSSFLHSSLSIQDFLVPSLSFSHTVTQLSNRLIVIRYLQCISIFTCRVLRAFFFFS